jgi:hypothetical protein
LGATRFRPQPFRAYALGRHGIGHGTGALRGQLDGGCGPAFLAGMTQDADIAIWFGQRRFDGGGQRGSCGFRDFGATAREGNGKYIIFQPFRTHAGKAPRLGDGWHRHKGYAENKERSALHAGNSISAARSFSISAAALAPGHASAREVSVILGWVMIQAAGSTSCASIAKTPISVRSP